MYFYINSVLGFGIILVTPFTCVVTDGRDWLNCYAKGHTAHAHIWDDHGESMSTWGQTENKYKDLG